MVETVLLAFVMLYLSTMIVFLLSKKLLMKLSDFFITEVSCIWLLRCHSFCVLLSILKCGVSFCNLGGFLFLIK